MVNNSDTPGTHRARLASRMALSLIAWSALAAAPALGQSSTDPRAFGAIALPELGRLDGQLRCIVQDERFGRQIYAIGDVDGDSLNDWILTHHRCDTSFGGYAVIELLLYHGVRGGLPAARDGIRIGPTEVGADCSFIGAGDYDGDTHRDIVVSERILDDPLTDRRSISSVVVFWNDGTGHFSVNDTTHLTAPDERLSILLQADFELWPKTPEHCDFDRDGVDDLIVVSGGYHYVSLARTPCPYLRIYRGHRGGRWGRGGIGTVPDWQFWQLLFTRRVAVLDHDGDGTLDIAMYRDGEFIDDLGGLAILYGVRGALPDTIAQQIDFVTIEGHQGKQGELLDVTGDRVPELIVSSDDTVGPKSWRWFVYAGRRSQRLLEQFGSGNDAPHPGDSIWWGRPWTHIWTPNHFDPIWGTPFLSILDPGDIGLDGVGDFCAYSYPFVVCYNGGQFFDSRIDAWMSIELAGLDRGRLTRLGDIDGLHRSVIAAPYDGGGVRFYSADARVPRGGIQIRLPEGSDVPVAAPMLTGLADASLELAVVPNPARRQTRVSWRAQASAVTLVLHDALGRDLRRWLLPAGIDALTIDVGGMPAGAYVLTVTTAGHDGSAIIVHTQ
jgi:hypothetical protein